MRYRKICPICNFSTKYISTHLRRIHNLSSSTDLKQTARSAENDRNDMNKLSPVVHNSMSCSLTAPSTSQETRCLQKYIDRISCEENDPLLEIARWIYFLPITRSEITQLQGPLRKEFEKCLQQQPYSLQVQTLLKTIHSRMTQ